MRAFEFRGLQKHHQKSSRRLARGKERKTNVVGEGKSDRHFGWSAQATMLNAQKCHSAGATKRMRFGQMRIILGEFPSNSPQVSPRFRECRKVSAVGEHADDPSLLLPTIPPRAALVEGFARVVVRTVPLIVRGPFRNALRFAMDEAIRGNEVFDELRQASVEVVLAPATYFVSARRTRWIGATSKVEERLQARRKRRRQEDDDVAQRAARAEKLV